MSKWIDIYSIPSGIDADVCHVIRKQMDKVVVTKVQLVMKLMRDQIVLNQDILRYDQVKYHGYIQTIGLVV